ncbi:hypothetical protein Droror1_Dr00020294 [Drosera rotundifolia]
MTMMISERQEVIIEKVIHNKHKCITTVRGLELFGIKLADASKKLGKKLRSDTSTPANESDMETEVKAVEHDIFLFDGSDYRQSLLVSLFKRLVVEHVIFFSMEIACIFV